VRLGLGLRLGLRGLGLWCGVQVGAAQGCEAQAVARFACLVFLRQGPAKHIAFGHSTVHLSWLVCDFKAAYAESKDSQ
jgi:hypothetical protein